jgi:RHS repeat-associated protein
MLESSRASKPEATASFKSVMSLGGGDIVSFKYDPFGRRIYKSSSSGTSIYAYDGDNLIEEMNSSGTAVARYAQGLNIDEPLAMLRSGATNYYEADGLGSLTSLSNTSGALATTYTYDSFGNLVASSGNLVNSFRYTGREFDAETSLYYYRARYYDPTTGRFVKEDGSELELELVRERINEYSERLFISALLFASSCANPAPRPACFG